MLGGGAAAVALLAWAVIGARGPWIGSWRAKPGAGNSSPRQQSGALVPNSGSATPQLHPTLSALIDMSAWRIELRGDGTWSGSFPTHPIHRNVSGNWTATGNQLTLTRTGGPPLFGELQGRELFVKMALPLMGMRDVPFVRD